MKYPTGEDVRLGDHVSLWRGAEGIVVCSLDTGEYSGSYPGGMVILEIRRPDLVARSWPHPLHRA